MSKSLGGALVGKALANEGIVKAFVLCGGHVVAIFYGMRAAGIEIVDMRHECVGVYAAMAYTSATGKPAAVVTTAGPGVLNTMPGMFEARAMGIPLIQIGGAVNSIQRDAGPLQDTATLSHMEACSKWVGKVTNAARIPEYVSLAMRNALDTSPGPVYLEIPEDFPVEYVDESDVVFPTKSRTQALPFGDPSLIDEAAELLVNAEKPVAMIADGARYSIGDHAADIAGLSDYLKMPLNVNSRSCRGLFGDEYENPLLNAGGGGDVILTLGCRFDFRLGQGGAVRQGAKVIQVHTDAQQIGFNAPVDIGIVGGVGPVASQLLAAVKGKQAKPTDASGVAHLKSGLEKLSDDYRAEGIPVHPARCAGEVAKFLAEEGRDWNIVIDGGESSMWSGGAVTATRPGQISPSTALGMIGTGPGFTIGAWIANRKPVLWYTGDGSFGFYAMEMDTMARLGIPVVCVISNDSGWGMIRINQAVDWPEEIEGKGNCNTDLSHMRAYEKIVSMWDGHGERVTDPAEIIPAIRRAVANGKPSIINVEVDKTSATPLMSMALKYGRSYSLVK